MEPAAALEERTPMDLDGGGLAETPVTHPITQQDPFSGVAIRVACEAENCGALLEVGRQGWVGAAAARGGCPKVAGTSGKAAIKKVLTISAALLWQGPPSLQQGPPRCRWQVPIPSSVQGEAPPYLYIRCANCSR